MRKRSVVFFFVAFVTQVAAQQRPSDYEVQYKKGMQLMIEESYEKAKAVFLPLTGEKFNNGYAPYAHYFAALANFRTQRYFESRLLLKQLFERYPNWNKNNEAYYLYANASFASNETEQAMEYVKKITDSAFTKDLEAMEDNFLSTVTSVPLLKKLYQIYPDDRLIALNLVDLIQRSSTDKQDLELSDRLTNRYGVRTSRPVPVSNLSNGQNSGDYSQFQRKDNTSKGYFNIGILFPFNLDETTSRRRIRDNQFALDMYEGIRLAKSQLQTEGIIVNLFAYDIENEASGMIELMNNTSFGQMDALIGPLYSETNKLAVTYCNQVKIPLINPLATDKELLTDKPFAYLIQPSLATQAQKAAEFVRDEFPTQTALILYGTSKSDSLLASYYARELTVAGVQVLGANRFSAATPEAVAAAIPDAVTKKIGHIFLASNSKNAGPALLSAIERKRISIPIVTKMDAFNFQENSRSQFAGRDLYFIAPDFMDDEKLEVKNFKLNYINKRGTLPSYFAYQGYDMMLFFGRMMGKYRMDIRNGLNLKPSTDGYTLAGFDYTNANENQRVPIYRLVGTKLTLVK